ncbi:MAG: hypothetical protein RI965_1780 [Bacteroidota bacterium]
MAKQQKLIIEKIAVVAKLSNSKTYQICLNNDEMNTVKTVIELMHHQAIKVLPNELETIDFLNQ